MRSSVVSILGNFFMVEPPEEVREQRLIYLPFYVMQELLYEKVSPYAVKGISPSTDVSIQPPPTLGDTFKK